MFLSLRVIPSQRKRFQEEFYEFMFRRHGAKCVKIHAKYDIIKYQLVFSSTSFNVEYPFSYLVEITTTKAVVVEQQVKSISPSQIGN